MKAFALPVLALAAVLAHAQAPEVVKLGFASPLTGSQAHYGKDNLNGARLALEELKQGLLSIFRVQGGKWVLQ